MALKFKKVTLPDTNITGIELLKSTVQMKSLADELGISKSAIVQWKQVPTERVGMVAQLTGISVSKLRPDLFPEGVA